MHAWMHALAAARRVDALLEIEQRALHARMRGENRRQQHAVAAADIDDALELAEVVGRFTEQRGLLDVVGQVLELASRIQQSLQATFLVADPQLHTRLGAQ